MIHLVGYWDFPNLQDSSVRYLTGSASSRGGGPSSSESDSAARGSAAVGSPPKSPACAIS